MTSQSKFQLIDQAFYRGSSVSGLGVKNARHGDKIKIYLDDDAVDDVHQDTNNRLTDFKTHYSNLKRNPFTFGCINSFTTKVVDKVMKGDGNHCVVRGNVQQGKTAEMINCSLQLRLIYKAHVIIVLDNLKVGHKKFRERFARRIREHIGLLYLDNSVNVDELIEYFTKDLVDSKTDKKLIDNTRVVIAHNAQINTALEAIKEAKKRRSRHKDDRPVVVITDESDLTAVFKKNLTEKEAKKENKRTLTLSEVYLLVHGTIRFTATPFAHLCIDDRYPVLEENFFEMKVPSSYISPEHNSSKFGIHHLKHDFYINGKGGFEYSEGAQKELCKYIDQRNKNLEKISQLPVYLWSTSPKIDTQIEGVGKFVESNYDVEAIVVYIHRSEVRIYYPYEDIQSSLPSDSTLQQILFHLQCHIPKLNSTEKYRNVRFHIHIIGYNMISRGESPRSEVDNFRYFKDIIFAQTIIVASSPTTCTDSLMQRAYRISGIFPGHEDPNFPKLEMVISSTQYANIKEASRWVKTSITKFNNTDQCVLKTIAPMKQIVDTKGNKSKPNKVTSKQSRMRKHKGEYYVTSESLKVAIENESNNIELTPGSVVYKIIKILSNMDDWANAEDIYNSETPDFWNLHGKTPIATIRGRLCELMETTTTINRIVVNNIYMYKIN